MRIKFATKVRFKNFSSPSKSNCTLSRHGSKKVEKIHFQIYERYTVRNSCLLRIKENMKRRHDASTVSIKFQFCELIIFYKKWKLSILPHYSIRKTNIRINFRSPWHDSFIHIYGLIPIYLASQYIYISISTIIYLSYVGEISNNDISSWQPFHLFQSCQCIFLPCFLHAFIILTFLVFILILLNYHMFGRVSDSCLKAVTSCFNNSFPNIRFFPSSRFYEFCQIRNASQTWRLRIFLFFQ